MKNHKKMNTKKNVLNKEKKKKKSINKTEEAHGNMITQITPKDILNLEPTQQYLSKPKVQITC